MGINEFIQVGNQIRKCRLEKGLTQKAMAELINIPHSTYSNYENNNREPGKEQLEKIAAALEVTTDYLLGRVNMTNIHCETQADRVRSMTDEELSMIIMCPYDFDWETCREFFAGNNCVQCCLEWLKSPCDEM